MTRKIILELEAEGSEDVFPRIMGLLMEHADTNCRFKVEHNLIPDIFSGKTIKIPEFVREAVKEGSVEEDG